MLTGKPIRTTRTFPWFQPPPAAPVLGGAVETLRPGPRFSCWLGHTHQYQQQPFPGSPAFAYMALGLSEFSPIGAGTHNRDQLRHFEVSGFASNSYWTSGLGGLVQGQYASAPLVVPGGTQTSVDEGLPVPELLPGQFENWIG